MGMSEGGVILYLVCSWFVIIDWPKHEEESDDGVAGEGTLS